MPRKSLSAKGCGKPTVEDPFHIAATSKITAFDWLSADELLYTDWNTLYRV